ncbi:MAG: phosphate/phosphite/phosphonate ABC transporter substrate-binding protein [Coleofasciculus sp. B1-GNL1-01]|uniref:phosphate/phosphite/phosphonate ABC transporter substrate-binding protein n=1 Tax=Coleofasciculus sp. B1-GNL1-01 TaxID=3068484 RepID=UPI0033046E4B
MLPKFLKEVVLLGLFTTLVSCGSTEEDSLSQTPTSTPTPQSTATGTLVLADVNKNAAAKLENFQPMADYLAARLEKFDIGVGEVKVAPDLDTMASLLKEGKVDIYVDSPYPAMIVSDKSGAEPILRRWKDGKGEYYGVIFTLAESEIDSLADLKGKMLAFEEPVSTSGYFLPLNTLLDADLKMVEKGSQNEAVAADEVGYVYSNDDENTIQWVLSGEVAAGAADYSFLEEIPEESRQALKILAETQKIARHLVIVRPGMDPELVQQIKTVLMEMDQTPEGKEVLTTFEETAKFDEFPVETSLDKMRQLYEQVEKK